MTFTKVVFELTSNWFRKWFSRKWECLVVTSNSVKLKSISSWPNLRAKTMEMIFRFYFHFKLLPALENRRERERENRSRHHRPPTSPASAVAPIAIAIDASIFAWSADRTDRDLAFVCSDLMIFLWVLFVFWEINDIIYSFGNRENVSNK